MNIDLHGNVKDKTKDDANRKETALGLRDSVVRRHRLIRVESDESKPDLVNTIVPNKSQPDTILQQTLNQDGKTNSVRELKEESKLTNKERHLRALVKHSNNLSRERLEKQNFLHIQTSKLLGRNY